LYLQVREIIWVSHTEHLAHLQTNLVKGTATVSTQKQRLKKGVEVEEAILLILGYLWIQGWYGQEHILLRKTETGRLPVKTTNRDYLIELRKKSGGMDLSHIPHKALKYMEKRKQYQASARRNLCATVFSTIATVLFFVFKGPRDPLADVDYTVFVPAILAGIFLIRASVRRDKSYKHEVSSASKFLGNAWKSTLKTYRRLGIVERMVRFVMEDEDTIETFIRQAMAGGNPAQQTKLKKVWSALLHEYAVAHFKCEKDIDSNREDDIKAADNLYEIVGTAPYFGEFKDFHEVRTNAYIAAKKEVEAEAAKATTKLIAFPLQGKLRSACRDRWSPPSGPRPPDPPAAA